MFRKVRFHPLKQELWGKWALRNASFPKFKASLTTINTLYLEKIIVRKDTGVIHCDFASFLVLELNFTKKHKRNKKLTTFQSS